MPRRSERRKNQKDAPGGGTGTNNGSNGSSGNKGNGKAKSGSSDSSSPGVRSLRPRPGKPKAPNGAKAGREKTNKNGGKRKSPKKDSSSYVSPSGEEYRPGDFAFVDSQRPDLPYHICKILQFKSPRRDVLIAEVVWFFRVQEVPESLYLLLQEDRKADQVHESYFDPRITQRELFIAHNVDTHSTLLFRGRCSVHEVDGVSSISRFLDEDNTFFYNLGYTPETRRLTREKEKEDYIPLSHQAVVPDLITMETEGDCHSKAALATPTEDDDRDSHADLVWRPVPKDGVDDEQLLMYLTAARSIALHAGLCLSGYLSEGNLAASSDETTQHAYDVLCKNSFDVQAALQELVKTPRAKQTIEMKCWSADEAKLFSRGVKQHGKHFHRIQKEYFPNRPVTELNEYYYYWKQSPVGRSSRAYRRQSKQKHIRLWKQMGKPQPPVNEREMVDLSSCDEDEEDNYRDMSIYACQLCYSRESTTWHHAGVGCRLLCSECQDHFFRLGEMKPVPERGAPPPILFKDYHQAVQLSMMESGRRNTRNNGASQSKKGLRSGKAYKSSESGSGEEESGTDSESSDDSTYADKEVHLSKLQRRKSILTGMAADEEEEEEAPPPPKKNRKLLQGKEEGDKAGGAEDPPLQSSPNKGAATFVKTSASAVSSEKEEKQTSSSHSDSNDEEDFRAPPTPPSFTRVGGPPVQGETSARTSLNYIHPQNAKYLMKAPVRPKEKGTRSALTTPNAAHHSASRSSSAAAASTAFQFPSGHSSHPHHHTSTAATSQTLPSIYHTHTLPTMYSQSVMGHQDVPQNPDQMQMWSQQLRFQQLAAQQHQQQQMTASKLGSAGSSSHASHYGGGQKNVVSAATTSAMEEAIQQQQQQQQLQQMALMAQGQVQHTPSKLQYEHARSAASGPSSEVLHTQMVQSMAESLPHAAVPVYPSMDMLAQMQAHAQAQAANQTQQQQHAAAQQMAAQYAMMQGAGAFLPIPMFTPEQYQAYQSALQGQQQQWKLLEQMVQQQQQPEMAMMAQQAMMAQYLAAQQQQQAQQQQAQQQQAQQQQQGQQPSGGRPTPIHKPVIVNT